MKKVYLLFLLISISYISNASSGGPDLYGYTWKDSNEPGGPTYNWIDIMGWNPTEVKLLSDDNTRGPFVMNFNFHYYWYDVNMFWVGSNGYLMFQNGQLSQPFPPIPSTTAPQDFLGIMTSDLNFDGVNNPAECWYWISGDHDSLVVSWIDVPFYSLGAPNYSGSNTFQVILSTVDSSITYQYKQQQGTYTANTFQFMSIGIENNSGNIGLQHSMDIYPPINYAVKFYAPHNSTYQANDASTNFLTNSESGGIFLVNGSSPFTMNADIKNVGNTTLAPFSSSAGIYDQFNIPQVTDNATTPTLTSGQSQLISYTNTFNPSITGTYQYVNQTLLSGDVAPSNDMKTEEIRVIDTTGGSALLSFDNGGTSFTVLSWTDGSGSGAGVYFVPPYYPCQVTKLRFFIASNPDLTGYWAELWDDDGPLNGPYTKLDSVYVDSSQILPGFWNEITLPNPLVITSDGFYVAWIMGGTNISLGCDFTAPFSNRTFEVLSGSWAIYRFRETQDLMINATIEPYSIPSSVETLNSNKMNLKLYPNPASDEMNIQFDLPTDENEFEIYLTDVSGRQLLNKHFENQNPGMHQLQYNLSNLSAGYYFLTLKSPGGSQIQKLIKE